MSYRYHHTCKFRSLIQLHQSSQIPNLSMVPIRCHSMTPQHFSILEQKLASNLHWMTTSQQIPLPQPIRILQTLRNSLNLFFTAGKQSKVSHISWSVATDFQTHAHSQLFEQQTTRIGVNGEWTACEVLEVWYQIRLTTSYYDN